MSHRIRSILTAGLLGAGVLGLAAVGTIRPSASPLAAGDIVVDPAGGGVDRSSAGRVELVTLPGGGFSLTWYGANGAPVTPAATRVLKNSDKCRLDVGAADIANLLEIAVVDNQGVAMGTAVGLVDNGLGSRHQNNCNRSNGRLEDGEGLSIDLGELVGPDIVVDHAILDLEGKHGARLEWSTELAGALVEGSPTGGVPLGHGNDNNADNGGTDNDSVVIGSGAPSDLSTLGPAADDFDRLVIAPDSADGRGDLSLEGGGDYNDGTSPSVFYLVSTAEYEHALVCYDDNAVNELNIDGSIELIGENPDDDDWTFTPDDLATVGYPASAQLFRYAATGEGKPPCDESIGVNLSSEDGDDAGTLPELLLDPSTADASLRLELIWVIPRDQVGGATDPFARFIDADGSGNLEPATYCDSFSGDAWNHTAPGTVVHPTVGGEMVPWCVLVDERSLSTVDVADGNGGTVAVDVVIQRMVWDGRGDPRFF
jgi:hypothetical protein